jgi:hypothetical protein
MNFVLDARRGAAPLSSKAASAACMVRVRMEARRAETVLRLRALARQPAREAFARERQNTCFAWS